MKNNYILVIQFLLGIFYLFNFSFPFYSTSLQVLLCTCSCPHQYRFSHVLDCKFYCLPRCNRCWTSWTVSGCPSNSVWSTVTSCWKRARTSLRQALSTRLKNSRRQLGICSRSSRAKVPSAAQLLLKRSVQGAYISISIYFSIIEPSLMRVEAKLEV